jgi:hypothetical protein
MLKLVEDILISNMVKLVQNSYHYIFYANYHYLGISSCIK